MEKRRRILYVDDEKLNLVLFEINFKENYVVLTATDGYNGLEILDKNQDIPVVISDMKMPLMSGLEFIKKAKEKYPDKKFYILTGYEITEEIKAALDAGLIIEYFSKPFEIKKMHQVIERAFITINCR